MLNENVKSNNINQKSQNQITRLYGSITCLYFCLKILYLLTKWTMACKEPITKLFITLDEIYLHRLQAPNLKSNVSYYIIAWDP